MHGCVNNVYPGQCHVLDLFWIVCDLQPVHIWHRRKCQYCTVCACPAQLMEWSPACTHPFSYCSQGPQWLEQRGPMSKYMMMPRLLHKYTHELNVVVQDLVDTIEKQKQDGGHRVDDVLGILHAWAFESEYVDVCTYIHAHKHLLSICVCGPRDALYLQALPSLFWERSWIFCAILTTSPTRLLNLSRRYKMY